MTLRTIQEIEFLTHVNLNFTYNQITHYSPFKKFYEMAIDIHLAIDQFSCDFIIPVWIPENFKHLNLNVHYLIFIRAHTMATLFI